jgi:hypothetical protein
MPVGYGDSGKDKFWDDLRSTGKERRQFLGVSTREKQLQITCNVA